MARPGAGGLHQTSPGLSTRRERLLISSCWGRVLGVHRVRSSPNRGGVQESVMLHLVLLQSPTQGPPGPSLPIQSPVPPPFSEFMWGRHRH